MKYTCSIAMGPIDQLVDIAKTAEEVGFDAIALPDSLFYMEKAAADYPYTPDGSRMWNEDTPWVDPLIAAGAMGAVTSKLFFYTNVMKLGSRNPLLLARQVGSVANLTNNRFGFGVGIGWAPEEFEWCGVPYAQARQARRRDDRGHQARAGRRDGRIPRRLLRLRQAADEPGPEQARAVLRRRSHRCRAQAGRPGQRRVDQRDDDCDQLAETIGKIEALLAEYGRADVPFEYQAVCIDKFGVDGHKELADVGVTDNIVIPWIFDGLGFDAPIEKKKDSLKRFADTYIHSGWQD